MKGNTIYRRSKMAAMSAVVALLLVTPMAVRANGNPNPGILPIHSHPHGMTYGEWSAAWWQYVYSLQGDSNSPFFDSNSPFFDGTGAHCGVGQAGHKVFFLVGVAPTATQSCTVPPGTMLFFPVLNAETDNSCPLVTPPMSVAELRSLAKSLMDAASNLHPSIDGVAVQNVSFYRVTSPVFSFTLPATPDNLCTFFSSPSTGASPGTTVSPVVGDGYYLMLAPLSPGQHTLTFGGAIPSVGFSIENTYDLTVSP